MSIINVHLPDLCKRSYPIYIEHGCLDGIGQGLRALGFQKGKCVLVTNPTVGSLYAPTVVRSLEAAGFDTLSLELSDGEEYKTLQEASRLYDRLIEERMDRTTPVVALGGGVIGDITGFVAATYLRGVPYVHVPTTLLAQVDSSVGGKTAVNHAKGKNLIGAFYQPRAVFVDPDVLKTLDKRQLRAGISEVVKYGVIWDEGFFRFLEENVDSLLKLDGPLTTAIERSCGIKAEVVGRDETEQGLRSILNFGHTFAHAVEKVAGYGRFLHGEAVSIGMVRAGAFSVKLGLCESSVASRIENLLSSIGLPIEANGLRPDELMDAMLVDKKVISGAMRFVLVKAIGEVAVKEVAKDEVDGFLGESFL